ncbi:hypothetical protein CN878_02875 [Ochrobactrum sp. 695/2009]|nr:hypothetical protein [Brucella intermedia]PJR89938.1 hypothetical protein CN881_12140 [Ochrobactrum sp. 721/2009]PJT14155.1 hypothetical protein CN880_21170 [Ochrobactrum sp. 720/2009]PJT24324.1 hypothetical protein CN879_08200 [Ochrobactrum sp. 715/2009]PJT30351.1 hypothetical protein CN878_02875 [Ochrobactrum sp. 695/2009]PJT33878.1 hypothetical protein CN877_09770 [Ochrobactrum sp. 689/2009]
MFSEENLAEIREAFSTIDKRANKIVESYLTFTYKSELAREYAHQGFARRIKTISYALQQVYSSIPPDNKGIPKRQDIKNAEINIHAFFANLAGCFDNLSWIFVHEKAITIKRSFIGISPQNSKLLSHFSEGFRQHVLSMSSWFEHLKDYRDTLVHRIPLYIPPYSIDPKNLEQYNLLSSELINSKTPNEYQNLNARLDQLKHFVPAYRHSLTETTKAVMFHPQMIADFATVEDISSRFLHELS